jgi:hypothetical protein
MLVYPIIKLDSLKTKIISNYLKSTNFFRQGIAMKLRHLISTILLSGLISSSVFAADFVNAPLTDGDKIKKDTSYDIQLVSQNGTTWTYNISKVEGYDLSHWVLGLAESCTVVSASPSHDGVQVDPSIENMGGPSFYGIKWNSSGGTFSFTLDQAYAATDLDVMVKAATGYGASVITGPDCDNPITSSSADDNGETADNGEINNDETDSDTQSDVVDTTPVTLTCPEGTSMLGSFDWSGASYILNGENVGGIAVTGGIEGASVAGANWAASAGTVSAVLIAGSETSVTETLSDAVSGSFSNSTLADDIASVMFCGTEGEQESLGVALPAQGSIVGRVWALACENDCEEYLGAKEVALDSADHVLEIVQPNGRVLFIPVSIMK